MKYFFILGNHAHLSLAEIIRVLESEDIAHTIEVFSSDAAIISSEVSLDLDAICNRLGGTIKAGTIVDTISSNPSTISDHLITRLSEVPQDKIVFGLSAYTLARGSRSNKDRQSGQKDIQRMGLTIKKELKAQGGVVRFIAPQQGSSLSSVVVTKNHLTQEGNTEYVLFSHEGRCMIGKTVWVQPFEQYSQRDWDRPEKSMDVGMLPPKLSQIMINLTGVEPSPATTLLDPFCGLGMVLQESWLMGFRNLIGSDLEGNNVEATEKNLVWLEKQNPEHIGSTSLKLFQSDVRQLGKEIPPSSIDCIVTEPYLGPIVNSSTPEARIVAIQKELAQLYIDAFSIFAKILKPNGIVSIISPIWHRGNHTVDLPIIDAIQKLGFKNETIPESMTQYMKETPRNSFLYSRAGQTVMRELFVWRKR